MRLENIKKVNTLIEIKKRCVVCLDNMYDYQSSLVNDGPIENGTDFNFGERCVISEYSDGSGVGAVMYGCYVGVQVAEATIKILHEQIAKVNQALINLGVEID